MTGYKITNEVKAETTNPLYKAPITFLLFPSFTKKVPIIDVNIHAPPMVKGKIIIDKSPGKNIDDKTIVATIVTA